MPHKVRGNRSTCGYLAFRPDQPGFSLRSRLPMDTIGDCAPRRRSRSFRGLTPARYSTRRPWRGRASAMRPTTIGRTRLPPNLSATAELFSLHSLRRTQAQSKAGGPARGNPRSQLLLINQSLLINGSLLIKESSSGSTARRGLRGWDSCAIVHDQGSSFVGRSILSRSLQESNPSQERYHAIGNR
jgi:hypothetical protein